MDHATLVDRYERMIDQLRTWIDRYESEDPPLGADGHPPYKRVAAAIRELETAPYQHELDHLRELADRYEDSPPEADGVGTQVERLERALWFLDVGNTI